MMGLNVSRCTKGQKRHPALMALYHVASISRLMFAGRMPCSDMIHVVYAVLRNRLHTVWSASTLTGMAHHAPPKDRLSSVHCSQ